MAHYSIMVRAMILNSLILIGFLLLMIADLLWTKARGSASALRKTGYAIIGCAFGLLVLAPGPSWPFPVQEETAEWMPGWRPGPELAVVFVALAAASGALLVWSVFFEIETRGKNSDSGASILSQAAPIASAGIPVSGG